MTFSAKYGWQCDRPGCYDSYPDRDDLRAATRLPTREGDRAKWTKAPLCHPLEGIDLSQDPIFGSDIKGYGEQSYGDSPYGEGEP